MRRVFSKRYGLLVADLTMLLVLAACSSSPSEPGTPQIVSFTATGLDLGEGEWLLSWETTGGSVTLNGETVRATATLEVPATATDYELIVRSGTETSASTITVGPVTGVAISDTAGRTAPFTIDSGDELQLQAVVSASAASVPPLQSVSWHSDPEGVVEVDSDGLVTAVGLGETRVYATSRQWTGQYTYAEFQSVDLPEIELFAATPVEDGSGAWILEWSVDAEDLTLNGEPVEMSGTRRVSPASAASYELFAANGDWTTEREITIAPVNGITVSGLGSPPQIGLNESRLIQAVVHATGSDVQPSQAVRFESSNPGVLSVTEDGLLSGIREGSARITLTSVQNAEITEEIPVEILGTGLYNLAVTGGSADLEAGERLSLSWNAVALESLTVTAVSSGVTGETQQVLPPSANGLEVLIPVNEGSVNFRFDWVDAAGVNGSQWLWDVEQQILGWVCNRADQIVTFVDPVIEAEVRRIFSPGRTIYCRDVQESLPYVLNDDGQELHNQINNNRCSDATPGPRVESLEGVQHLIHLVRLELECNEIEDISRLASMTGLEEINFDNNFITDVSPLTDLTEVRILGLYNNNVAEISSLANLTNLEVLYLSENHVLDVSPLAELHELRHVWLYLNCRTKTSDAWSNCLRDLSPLSGLTQVRSFVFHMNEIEDISFINSGMTELRLVVATGNRIAEAGVLADLPALVTAAVDDNYLTTLDPFVQNSQFGEAAAYSWTRGTVSMPPAGHELNGINLAMGYNCFDPTVAPVADQLAILEARGAVIAGQAIDTKACGPGTASTELNRYRMNLLNSWRSPH